MSDLADLISKAVTSHELNTPKPKRKAVGQLSAEKQKPHKTINMSPNNDQSEGQRGARPKPLRVPASNLNTSECVASFSTRNAILKKDATHTPPPQSVPTIDDIKQQINDKISNESHHLIPIFDKHLKSFLANLLKFQDDEILANLDIGNPNFTSMINEFFTIVQKFIVDQKILDISNPLGGEAITSVASLFVTNASIVTQAHKEKFVPLFSVVKTVPKEIISLMILGASFDQIWHALINITTVPKTSLNFSLSTLSQMHTKLSKTVSAQAIQNTELDHQVTKLAHRLGDLRTSEVEAKYLTLEYEIRIHGINSLGQGTAQHFRTQSFANQVKEVNNFVESHLDSKNVSFSTQILKPKQGARQFETLVIISFSHTTHKYEFEKNFSLYRRENPNCTISTSRPTPQRSPTDRDMPSVMDVRQQIGMLYNAKIAETKMTHPQITFTALSTEQIDNLQVALKTKYRPFKVYFEFLDPSNGTTFCHYNNQSNPFDEHDFTEATPNPLTRKHAMTDPGYKQVFQPRIFKKK